MIYLILLSSRGLCARFLHECLQQTRQLSTQVMHDVHDQSVALARMFKVPRSRFESVIDMQIVQEALTGDPLSSFVDCLRYFNLYDDTSWYVLSSLERTSPLCFEW